MNLLIAPQLGLQRYLFVQGGLGHWLYSLHETGGQPATLPGGLPCQSSQVSFDQTGGSEALAFHTQSVVHAAAATGPAGQTPLLGQSVPSAQCSFPWHFIPGGLASFHQFVIA